MATQMQLKVLFGRKESPPGLLQRKQQQSRVFFGAIFYVYTNVDKREWARAIELLKTKESNFVGRKTWKFKAAMRKWEMLAASKVKMSGSEK